MALNTNLISYWKLDNNSADALGVNNGTDGGSLTYATGRINQGVSQTDGATGLGISFGTGTTLDLSAYPLSVSAWFKTSSSFSQDNDTMRIFGSQLQSAPFSNYLLQMDMGSVSGDRGKIALGYRNTAGTSYFVTSSSLYNDGAWHFATGTIDGSGNMKLYIDGSLVASGTTATGTLSPSRLSTIGSGSITSANDVWVGQIDEVGVWSRELSSTEVTSLYNGGGGFQYPFVASAFTKSIIKLQAVKRASFY